jgi:hypothetical protein
VAKSLCLVRHHLKTGKLPAFGPTACVRRPAVAGPINSPIQQVTLGEAAFLGTGQVAQGRVPHQAALVLHALRNRAAQLVRILLVDLSSEALLSTQVVDR